MYSKVMQLYIYVYLFFVGSFSHIILSYLEKESLQMQLS